MEVEASIVLDETFGYSKDNGLEIISQVGRMAGARRVRRRLLFSIAVD